MKADGGAAPRILTAPYYERLDDLERRHWWCRSVRRAALALVEPFVAPGAVVLDAGCGAGGLLDAAAKRWPGVRAVGVDVSLDALEHARRRGLRGLMAGSAVELPVPAEKADIVFSNDVLQHLDHGGDARAVTEALRVLKPGGVFCVRTNLGHDRTGGARSLDPSPAAPARALHRRYARQRLAELIRTAGFRIERHVVLHWLPAVLSRAGKQPAEGHASEEGLSTRVPAAPLNLLMDLYVRAEDFFASRVPMALPAGDTQIVLARKAS